MAADGANSRTLASVGDFTLRLWNVADPAHPTPQGRPLEAHTRLVRAVAFKPDGRAVVSGSQDMTVRLWDLDVEHAIQRICTTTSNSLTPAKWEQYVSNLLPYQPPCPR